MDRLLEIFRNFPVFDSDRLLFRDIRQTDVDDLFEIYNNDATLKYQVISPFRSVSEMKRYVEIIRDGYQNKYFIRWGLEHKESGKLIGLISLHHLEFWNYKAEVGYILNEAYWNQGLATEAVKKLLDISMNGWGLHRIEAAIHPINAPSIRVVEKLGFSKEGYRKEAAFDREKKCYQDRVMYAILSEKKSPCILD